MKSLSSRCKLRASLQRKSRSGFHPLAQAREGLLSSSEDIIVPDPSTYALLALSAVGLGDYGLRRRRK